MSQNCELFNLVVEFDECTSDSTYRIVLDVDTANTGGVGFDLFANNEFFNFYNYSDLPITINNFPTGNDLTNHILLCDNDNLNCCIDTSYATPSCGAIGNCDIRDLTAVFFDCANGLFFAEIDCIHENTSDSFLLSINQQPVIELDYDDLPFTIGPLVSNTSYELLISDLLDPNCNELIVLDSSECDSNFACAIFDLEVEFVECTSDSTYRAIVNFEFVSPASDFFDLSANGEYFGTYGYVNLPIIINDFPLGGGPTNSILICDDANPNCCEDLSWPTPNCGSTNDCDIRDVTAEVVDCENGEFFVILDFIYENASDSFNVGGSGINYGTFAYIHVPLTLGPLTSNAAYEFIVTDNEEPNLCNGFVEVGAEVCDSLNTCEIFNLSIDFVECTSDSTYRAVIDFDFVNVSGQSFDLWINGRFIGFYAYAALPLSVNHIPVGNDSISTVMVCDNDNANCCTSIDYPTPHCGNTNDCSISDLIVREFDCDSNGYFLSINFNHQMTGDSFELRGNGHLYGVFSYNDLPIELGPFTTNMTVNEIVVIDQTFANCAEDVAVDVNCGGGNECRIGGLEVVVGSIHPDSTFQLTFNFQYRDVSDSFDVFSGNSYLGSYSYADLPITIANFPSRNLPYELLRVCDSEHQDCCAVIEFLLEEGCETCKISDMSAAVVECFGDSIVTILIDFDVEEGSTDGFEVVGNGNNYGTFNYNDLPVEITFDYEEGDVVDLIIRDLDDPTCLGYVVVDEVDCNEVCELDELSIDFQECTSDSTYNFILDFEHTGTGGLGFDLFTNGVLIGFYSYSGLPYLVENFNSSGVQIDRFRVCDNDNPNCCATANVPIPSCITGLHENDNENNLQIGTELGQWVINVSEPGQMTIYDMIGREVRPTFTIQDEMNVSDLASGTYLITWTGWWGTVSKKAIFINN